MTFDGDALRTLRVSSLLSQRELARRAGISPGSVADLESGRRNPSRRMAARLADALGVSVAELAPGWAFSAPSSAEPSGVALDQAGPLLVASHRPEGRKRNDHNHDEKGLGR